MSRRPPLPMPDGFDGGEAVWSALTRRQQEAILDGLYSEAVPDKPADIPDNVWDRLSDEGKRQSADPGPPDASSPGRQPTRARARAAATRARRGAAAKSRKAGRSAGRAVASDVRAGARRAVAPGRHALVNTASATVAALLVIGLYHLLRFPDNAAGVIGGVQRFALWLTQPVGIPARKGA